MLNAAWRRSRYALLAVTALIAILPLSAALAESVSPVNTEGPLGLTYDLKAPVRLTAYGVEPLDVEAAKIQARDLDAAGEAPAFALPAYVRITPDTHGEWEDLDARFQVWRLRVSAPGALSLNFGFDDFRLPKGARLSVYPADLVDVDDPRGLRVFTERDTKPHGELWTPVILADEVVLELLMPVESRNDYHLVLTSVNRGFRFLGEEILDKQGTCNIDVICPEGDPWRTEINSVGVYTINGTWYCTGAMINNTAQDGTPYFLTANHCEVTPDNDQGIVVYWDFQSPNCGDLGGGSLDRFQAGSTFLAAAAASDFCLLRLDDYPLEAHHVTYAGWDRRNTTSFPAAVGIHHPETDEMAISFEDDPTSTTSYLQTAVPGDATHIRIIDWDLGTTEPGSSGSPLFSPDHHIIGQLHGGYAACGNNESDWYGRLYTSFPQITAWLDPLGTGRQTLDTYDPQAGLFVAPNEGFAASGDAGGPFTPDSQVYTVANYGGTPLSYDVSTTASWLSLTNAAGTLTPGASVSVTVALNATAASLPTGSYAATVLFTNTTDGIGDTQRSFGLVVGAPEVVFSFPMDADPGWSMPDMWAFGVPQGGGGVYGEPDPTSGFTGDNVIGYNLDGDYEANLDEIHLLSTALDLSDVSAATLKFQRWLNVEDPTYDHASLAVSNDGETFVPVWSNSIEITDAEWTEVSYDISAVADGESTVFLRWTMGTTDGSWQYSGWNIDDVEIWGLVNDTTDGPEIPDYALSLGNYPNPFNPLTRVEFTLETAGPAQVEVYDVQGRLVRVLADRVFEAGPHHVIWDGTARGGARAASGLYFARLRSGGRVAEHKMVLLK